MAETFKELADSVLAAKPTAAYTVPGSTTGKVKTLLLSNLGPNDVAVHIYAGTGPVATSTRARNGSNVATIVTGSAHGLSSNDYADIQGLGGTGYNATRVQVTVSDTTTFTYANTGSSETTTSDTGGAVMPRAKRVLALTVKAEDTVEFSPAMPLFLSAAEVLTAWAATAGVIRLHAIGSEVT